MKIKILPDHLLDCGRYPLIVDLTDENHSSQYYAVNLIGTDVTALELEVDETEYRKAVMSELIRRMPNMNSVQKKKGEVYAVTRSYQGKMFVDHLLKISADPAPHREDYIFYP